MRSEKLGMLQRVLLNVAWTSKNQVNMKTVVHETPNQQFTIFSLAILLYLAINFG
jgi:hypothetical protein